jgi:purine nucleoside phosphorylase
MTVDVPAPGNQIVVVRSQPRLRGVGQGHRASIAPRRGCVPRTTIKASPAALRGAGAGVVILTNAAGGLRAEYRVGRPLRHDEVLAAGRDSAGDVGTLLAGVLAAL